MTTIRNLGNKKRGPELGRVQLFNYKSIISFGYGVVGTFLEIYIWRGVTEIGGIE
jgi:hypothetical protein